MPACLLKIAEVLLAGCAETFIKSRLHLTPQNTHLSKGFPHFSQYRFITATAARYFYRINQYFLKMKKNLFKLLLAVVVIGSAAFTVRVLSILEQLKIAEQDAKEYILSDFTEGSLNFPYSEVLKTLATSKRADAVKQIGEYIRKYTESPEFQKEFQAIRESMSADKPVKKTKEQLLQEKIESLKHDIKTTEEDMKSAPASMKKLYEETLKQQRENLAALENPSHPKHKMYVADLVEFYEEDFKQATAGQDNSVEFPETPRELVKQRLKEFLAFTADIDWEAKLVTVNGYRKFADPALEAKSTEWKRCFRAGKETITAARSFAQGWLASLK